MKYFIYDSEGLLLHYQLITSRRLSQNCKQFRALDSKIHNLKKEYIAVCVVPSLSESLFKFGYCCKIFNFKQRMEPRKNCDSASRPGLQFVSVNVMSMALYEGVLMGP